jgi:HEAT repeat protein
LAIEDLEVRESSSYALGRIGTPAVEPLIKALDDEDQFIRSYAALSLGKIGDNRSIDPLVKVLADEKKSVRSNAAIALGFIGDENAVEPLIGALKDEDWVVRNSASDVSRLDRRSQGRRSSHRGSK